MVPAGKEGMPMPIFVPVKCAVCEREMHWGTKPRWVFDENLKTLGQAHTGCTDFHSSAPADCSENKARFHVFIKRQARPDRDSDRYFAHVLAMSQDQEPVEELNPTAVALLAWWQNDHLKMEPERIGRIKASYQGLLREFQHQVAA